MKKNEFIKIAFSILSIYVLTALVACDNNKDEGHPLPPPPPAPALVCPAGSSLDVRNLCVTPNGQIVSSSNSTTLDFISDTYDGTLTIKDSAIYRTFLKNSTGVCDNALWGSIGDYSCKNWDGGRLSVVILADPAANQLYSYFWVYKESNYNPYSLFNYYGGAYAGPQTSTILNPLVLTMPTSPINGGQNGGGQGFMAQSRGNDYTKSYKSVISIIVNQGKIQDGYFDYMLSYSPDGQPVNATVFASGRFTRCATKQCVNR